MSDLTTETDDPATFFGAVRPYRHRVAFTYCIMLVENILELLYPFAIGLAINGLIAGDGLMSLAPFAGIWFVQSATATFRQLYDTRLFAKIYGEVSGRMIVRQRAAGVSTGEVAARSVMAREAVDFFEFEIPTVVTALISLVGGVAMLSVYDFVAGAAMAGMLVPIAILFVLYGKRSLKLSQRLNNRHEREVAAIESGRPSRVRKHFSALARWRIMLSDIQAGSWALSDFLSACAAMFVILRVTAEPGVQAGDVFAAVSYLLTIIMALDQAPLIVEQLSRLVDIRRRVDKSNQ
ncbi:MAG: ABC transporter six-transmembrane domain-containing protein [Pseudomonadota bacterium]